MRRIFLLFFLSLSIALAAGCSTNLQSAPKPMTREELISQIAVNLQSLAPVNTGEFQLMQIKMSLENLNYSEEELKNFADTVAARVKNQRQYKAYSQQMYEALVRQFDRLHVPAQHHNIAS